MGSPRRNFLLTGGLLTVGAAFGGIHFLSGGPCIDSAKRDVAAFVGRYGTILQTSVKGEHSQALQVKMRSIKHFVGALNHEEGLPFERIHAAGNTLKFKHNGVDFSIVNVV